MAVEKLTRTRNRIEAMAMDGGEMAEANRKQSKWRIGSWLSAPGSRLSTTTNHIGLFWLAA